jgi:hypothetical protein
LNAYELFNRLAAPVPADSEAESAREMLLELARETVITTEPAMTLAAMRYLNIGALSRASETQLRVFIDLVTE